MPVGHGVERGVDGPALRCPAVAEVPTVERLRCQVAHVWRGCRHAAKARFI